MNYEGPDRRKQPCMDSRLTALEEKVDKIIEIVAPLKHLSAEEVERRKVNKAWDLILGRLAQRVVPIKRLLWTLAAAVLGFLAYANDLHEMLARWRS